MTERVLQGVTGQAAQPGAYAIGLRENGVIADACSIVEHKFGYRSDIFVETEGKPLNDVFNILKKLAENYDIFHFHGRSFINKWPLQGFPAFQDIIFLKLLGKKVYFHFPGQEVRLSTVFADVNPYHYVRELRDIFIHQPDRIKVLMRDFLVSICDAVFVLDPEILTYVPGAQIMPRALHEADWEYSGFNQNKRPLIVHAPSSRKIKGTDAFLAAADQLQSEGCRFDVKLIEDVPYSEAVCAYREADIIVDQLRIGWYGVLAVEAMALGKPTVAYIRDDLWRDHGATLPIVNANPDNVADVLRVLIKDSSLRMRIGLKSREYFLAEHTAKTAGAKLLEVYRRPFCNPDLSSLAKFLVHQNFARDKV